MMRRNLWRYAASVAMLAAAVWLAQRSEMGEIDPRAYARAGAAMALVTALSMFRLKVLARAFGHKIHTRTAGLALAAGHFAGTLVLPVLGALAAQTLILDRAGVPMKKSMMIFAATKALGTGTIGGAGIFAALWLFAEPLHFAAAVTVSFALAAIVIAAMPWIWGRINIDIQIRPMLVAVLLTACMHVTTFAAWAFLIVPHVDVSALDAAAAIILVMFAASIPIGLAGFGPREIGAVATFGLIGVPAAQALAVSIGIGVISLVMLTVLGIWAVQAER